MSKYEQNRLLVLNEPLSPRLSPALAKEIGLNESILFLQLEFLIAVSSHEHDDKRWTYQSQRSLQEIFPFWSTATIHRAVKSLEEQELIFIGNYNKRKADRTRWFAINPTGVARLQSISLLAVQNEPTIVHNELDIVQNELTLPKITTERKTNTHSKKELPSLPAGEEETNPPKKTDPPKNQEPTKRDIQYQMMCTIGEVCQMDTKLNNGQISKRAKELLGAGYTAAQVEHAYSGDSCWWYRHDWRGKKGQAPKPGQIHETIKAAMATGKHTGPSNSGGHIPSS